MRNVVREIGVDPGCRTGIAVWNKRDKALEIVATKNFPEALTLILSYENVLVRFEDARLRKWIPKHVGRERLQGAGSIKCECRLWEDFLTFHKIPFEKVPPMANKTKLEQAQFAKITGWNKTVSGHGRDAAMLVFGR